MSDYDPNNAADLAELDRLEIALVPPWAHGPAAAAWQQQFTPHLNGAPQMTHDPQFVPLLKALTEHPVWGGEYVAELEQRKRMTLGGELTAQAMQDAANAI